MTDEEIDTSDIPPLDESFFATAQLRLPKKSAQKVAVTLKIDADVLEWFRSQDDDFQTRINAALRLYANAHRES